MRFILSFKYFKEIYYAIGFLCAVLLVGTLGYIYLEDYHWMDAFYMTVITLSTVGFGEVRPLHPAGKLFIAFDNIHIRNLCLCDKLYYTIFDFWRISHIPS